MNKEDKFNKKPNTTLGFCTPPRIRVDGSNHYVDGICTPTEKGTQYGHILLSNGEILRNVNPKTDLSDDKFNTLLADGVMEYTKNREGNHTNQDQESREFRDATSIIEEQRILLKEKDMKISRLSEESKLDDFINKETKKMGTSLSNIRGGGSDSYDRDGMMRAGHFQNKYPEESEETEESANEDEPQQSREEGE